MCGRFGLTTEQEALSVAIGLPILVDDYCPRYNIAPSDDALVVVQSPQGMPEIAAQRWGFTKQPLPDGRAAPLLINARSETVATRPTFRGAWRDRRRCLVLADGFYEWSDSGRKGAPRTPHWIQLKDGRPFGFAALYEDDPTGEHVPQSKALARFTILTTEPNDLVARIHDRMPVILSDAGAGAAWVDPSVGPDDVLSLLRPVPAADMRERTVSTYVNDARHQGPRCIEAESEQKSLFDPG